MVCEYLINFIFENEIVVFVGKFVKVLIKGDIVLLFGDIGVGKSFFCCVVLCSVFGVELEVFLFIFIIV